MTAAPAAERAAGYTPWEGKRTANGSKWWIIARGNLALAWANRWVKTVFFASLVPGIVAAGVVYFFLPLSSRILLTLMQTSVVFVFLIGALVGARLISEDRRQGAFIAHFSRPVQRRDYLLGKAVALAAPLFVVASLAGLCAIAADLAVSNQTVADRLNAQGNGGIQGAEGYLTHVPTLPALGMVLGFALLASLTTTGIVLGLSALTTRTRTAGLVWFAVVALGSAAHGILQSALRQPWPALLSWSDGLSDIAAALAGRTDASVEFGLWPRALLLAAVSAAGILFVDYRLRAAEGGER